MCFWKRKKKQKASSAPEGTSSERPIASASTNSTNSERPIASASTKDTISKRPITSARIKGRWYGMMVVLGEKSGRNMSELLGKDKATELLTMLEISNEFPEDFEVVNELLAIEKELESKEGPLSPEDKQGDNILGALEAKKVHLGKRPWSDLKILSDL